MNDIKKTGVAAAMAFAVWLPVMAQSVVVTDTLPDVVITGTGTQHLLRDVPVHTELISRRTIEQYGAASIEQLLGALSSSFAFNEGDMGSQMQMNGLGNNYILILVDGRRLHGDVGGENDLALIDPQNIDHIEIVKGAASALYGSDAIAGVINIITRKHDEGIGLENSTRIGSYGDIRQHNTVAITWEKLRSLTNFQLQHSDGWQNTSVEATPSSTSPILDSRNKTVNRHTNWQVQQMFTLDATPMLQLYLGGSAYGKGIYRPQGKYAKYDIKTFDLTYRNTSAQGGGEWTTGRGDKVSLDIEWARHAYYHSFTSTTLAEGFDPQGRLILDFPYFEGQRSLQSDQRRTMAQIKGVFALPEGQRLSIGGEWRHDYLKSPTSLAGGTATDNTGAVYVQDEWTRGMLNITGGLRLNHNSGFGWKLTPKLSAMMSMGDLRLRAAWSQGFKTPTLKELNYRYLREMTSIIMYLGNPNLKAQTSNYCSLSGEWTRRGWNLTATIYYNKVEDMITLVTIPRHEAPEIYRQQYGEMLGKVRQYANMEDARTCGLDLSVKYTSGPWSAGLTYSYLDTDAHVYDSDHERLDRVVIDGTAYHKATCYGSWQHRFTPSYQLGVGVYGRMSSKRYYQLDGDGHRYQTWRVTTTHDVGHSRKMSYRVEAGIDNLFNYVDRTPHGLHLGTTTPGRTVYATLQVRFLQGKKVKLTNNKLNQKPTFNNEDD